MGYGEEAARALAHPESSHNDGLRQWLSTSKYSISIAGPYRDEEEGKNVESALISQLQPEFNRSPGEGLRFVPLGVPPDLSDRPSLSPLSVSEIGIRAGGALIVYLAPGELLPDGREKYDPAKVDDDVILSNMDRAWALTRLIDFWQNHPNSSPRLLVGAYGPNLAHRFVVGAVPIDIKAWGRPEHRLHSDRWQVPVLPSLGLDEERLRGVRISDAKFGSFSWQLHIWVDKDGHVLHSHAHNFK